MGVQHDEERVGGKDQYKVEKQNLGYGEPCAAEFLRSAAMAQG